MKARRQPLFRLPFAGIWVAMLLILIANAPAAQRQVLRSRAVALVRELNLPAMRALPSLTNLDLAIGLPLRNQDALTNLLQQLYDPTSPEYHHWLTPEEFTAKFGPTEQDYQAVIDFAMSNGFTVTGTHPGRTLLDVRGSVATIERTFQLTMSLYRHPTETRMFYAPDVEPSLDLSVPVLNINGLNNYAVPRPKLVIRQPAAQAQNATPNSGSGPGATYTGHDFRAAYVPGVSATGSGQVVGLIEFDGYYAGDISTYESQAGLSSVTLKNVLLDGFSGVPTTGFDSANDEVALDIEMAISMAPGLSKVIVYEAGPNGIANDVLSRMVSDNQAKELSSSWSYGVLGPDPTADQFFQQMAAQGQSFFQASGDNDAFSGSTADLFPSDDPYITQVGGTTLSTTGPGGNWSSETVWNGGDFFGGGGGISTVYSIPNYQQGLNMSANNGSTTERNVPDVAMVADNIGFVADNGQQEAGTGTSFAAPLWAAFTALVNQQAVAAGHPTVGSLNPAIYAIGKSVNYTSNFHDIKTGDNTTSSSPSKFFAVTGYDLCTGWGSPNGGSLIDALASLASCAYTIALSSSPPGGGSASGAGFVLCGSDATVTATPGPCYDFVDWTENGVEVSTSPAYTFTPATNRTLVASFIPVTNVLINTDSSPAEGGITGGDGSVPCGSSVTVSAVPNDGYSFANWTDGGAVVSSSSNYMFTASNDRTLVANFLCSSSIFPTSASYDQNGGDGSVTVTDPLNCVWIAGTSAPWITILSGTSGSTDGTVSYRVDPNAHAARTGTMTIAGQAFTVKQVAFLNCFFALPKTNITIQAKGGTKTAKVKSLASPCPWTAVSNDPFITIISGSTGRADGTIVFTVPGNTNASPLTGTMTIAGQTFTVNQAAGGCTFKLSPKTGKIKAAGGGATVKVAPNFSDCTWTAVSNDGFITITNGVSGTGKGTVFYTVTPNTNTAALTGSITIGGQTFTVTQLGAK